jgi:hypothetical protein
MIRKLFWRIFVGFCFALPLGIFASVSVKAQTLEEVPKQDECVGCHEITQDHWQEGAHGNSFNDPVFQKSWQEQDSPAECLACHTSGFDPATGAFSTASVSCSVCHGPEPGNHPEDIMPTDISSRLCGTCHLDTHAEWESSSHGKEDLACVRCHDGHSTEIRAGAVQELCQSCHNEAAHFYNDTAHAQEGLLCSDCHLRVSETDIGDGHGRRVHSFTVDLNTCSSCHSGEMHYPIPGNPMSNDGEATTGLQPVLSMASMPTIQSEPDPVGPLGFAVLASLVGMGFGIVLGPWLSKWSRHSNKGNENE